MKTISVKTIYLVTGATGHLGHVIVRRLTEKGCKVRALVLPGDVNTSRIPPGTEIIAGDLLDKESLTRFFAVGSGIRAVVIHCAGIVSTCSSFSKPMYDVNVTGTRNIVDLCLATRAAKLVYVSSVHALPVLPRGQKIREIGTFSADRVKGPYAKTKAEATAYVMEAAQKGLDASVVFPGGLLGPGDYCKGHMLQLVLDYTQGRLPVAVQGGFDFVDVRDVADGVISCCSRGKKGEGYILAGRYITVREMMEFLHQATGRRRTRIFLPVWMARVLVPFCALYYRIRKQPPLFSSYSLYTLTCNADFSHEKAAKVLGFKVRPFMETVVDTVKWLVANILPG